MCTFKRRGILRPLLDNEETFLSMLQGIVDSVDELSHVEINLSPKAFAFRIAPSTPRYSQPLLEEILKFHTRMGITLELSKSIRTTGTISFTINTLDQ